MKRIGFLLVLVLALVSTMGCMRKPYPKPIIEEIGANETAFLVALEGDTKATQVKMDSLEFYDKAKVATKRIEIPQRWLQTGRKDYEGQWIPTMKLIKVDRTPQTRLWYNEGQTVGDKSGINVETRSSVGVTFGISLSARIEESDTSKFLYYYSLRPLTEVMDKEVYGTVTAILGNIVGKLQYEEMTAQKDMIVASLQKQLTEQYARFGITIYGIGLYRGIIPDNPDIQKAIDNKIIAENNKEAAKAQVQTAEIKSRMTNIDSAIADIERKRAITKYINDAADNKIKLVPDVMAGDSRGLIINLGDK